MDKRELRSKRAVIRREIKERMQQELNDRKKEIKRRIKSEEITVEEKREKYRTEVRQEKLRLMETAKGEFQARKRMLGEADEDSFEEIGEAGGEFSDTPAETPLWRDEENMLLPEDIPADSPEDSSDEFDPESAFILEDGDTKEREALREYQSPIVEDDALPPEAERWVDGTDAGPEPEAEDVEPNGLFYFIINLILHPIQTLDEFDEYIASSSGLAKVAIFYLVSLLPMIVFAYMAQSAGSMPSGVFAGPFLELPMLQEPSILMALGRAVLDLLLFSLSIAIVNYFISDQANFITLATYFAFVEGVTSVIIYALAISAVLAAVLAPELLTVVVLLFLALAVWRFALNIIVLMCAYGYGVFSALLLVIGAGVVRRIASVFIAGLFGAPLEEAMYSS